MISTSRTLLGFDFGTKKIGVAVGQEQTGDANPLKTLPAVNSAPDWAAISKLIEQWQPDALVLGLPVHMDGTEQPLTQAARRFGRQLEGRYQLPVHLADERLTTVEARQSHSKRGDVDAVAAQIILQTWLDNER